jgi:hypothetical protein
MTTADSVRDLALILARSGLDQAEAVYELRIACGGRRVSVVRARQMMEASLESDPDQLDTEEAIALLDELLARLPA